MKQVKSRSCLFIWYGYEEMSDIYILDVDHDNFLGSVDLFIETVDQSFIKCSDADYDIVFKKNYLVFKPNKRLYDKLLLLDTKLKLCFKRRLLKNYIVIDQIYFSSLGRILKDKEGIEYVL